MSATRVESPHAPRLLELRVQPSPPFAASTTPKPRACRKLFPVDHAETDRFLRDQLAAIERQQRREIGFDAGKCEPLPDQSGSRYTQWEAVPAERVPSFYHEAEARRKPSGPSSLGPAPPSSRPLPHRSADSGSYHPGLATSSNSVGETLPTESGRLETGRPCSFSPVSRPEDVRPVGSKPSNISRPRPSQCSTHPALEQDSGSDGPYTVVKAKETVNANLPSKQRTTKLGGVPTQSKVTDFYRQRKRNGPVSSSSSPTAKEVMYHQVPTTKRRRSASSGRDSTSTEGHS